MSQKPDDEFYAAAEKAAEAILLVAINETKGPAQAMMGLDMAFKALLTIYASAELNRGKPIKEVLQDSLGSLVTMNLEQGEKIQEIIDRLTSLAVKTLNSEEN